MEQEFTNLVARAAALRLTETEMREGAGVSKVRYWRAKNNKTKLASQIKVIRELEIHLTELEFMKGLENGPIALYNMQ